MFGCDYSYQHPDPTLLKAAGMGFVVRYLGDGGPGKALTAPEVAQLKAAGLTLVSSWESTAQRARAGHAAGVADATAALREARAVGMPPDRPIYFAVDWNWQPSDAAAVTGYFRGLATVLPVSLIGMYGGYAVIAWAFDQGLAAWYWQTYAWSGNRWAGHVHIEQYRNGVTTDSGDIDLDRAVAPDYGGWNMSVTADSDPTPQAIADAVATTPEVKSPVPGDPTPVWTEAEMLNYLGRDVRETLADIKTALTQLGNIGTTLGGLQPDEVKLAAALATDPTFVTSLAAALAAHITNAPDPAVFAQAALDAYIQRLETGPPPQGG